MSLAWLKAEGFRQVSALVLSEDGRMRLLSWKKCEGAAAPSSQASLYVFIDRKSDEVLYVGKAGKGWSTRRPQHNGGYGRAAKGLGSEAYRARISKYQERLTEGADIAIYERPVASPSVLDAEEANLICKFQPPMNVKGKC